MNTNLYNIPNEQLLLVTILNDMYNDNNRQINRLNNYINNINQSNRQIRDILIEILYNRNNTNTNNTNTNNNIERTNRSNVNRNRNRVNTLPSNTTTSNEYDYNNLYIDSIQYYRIPNNTLNRNLDNTISRFIQDFYRPVDVYPSQRQIEISTRRVNYCDIVSPRNLSCPISLETFNDTDIVGVIRHCGHIFKYDELITWFRTNCVCPVCRYDIRNYIPSENEEETKTSDPENEYETIYNNLTDASGNSTRSILSLLTTLNRTLNNNT